MLAEIRARLAAQAMPPLVTVDECRRSMEIITGIYKSAMTGARVDFPIARDDPFYSKIPPDGFGLSPITRSAERA